MFDWGTFAENPFRFSSANIHSIEISDVKYEVFLLMIKYIYTGSLLKSDIAPEMAIPLFVAQNQYLLDSSMALSVIKDNVSEQNVLDILSLCLEFSFSEISEHCHKYLLSNIETNYVNMRSLFREKRDNGTLEGDTLYLNLVEASPIWEMVINNDDLEYKSQWVSSVVAFSSEYTGWPATNVIGASNTFPEYGDLKTAWAPKAAKGASEFLELKFPDEMFIAKVEVYETYNPGGLVKITGKSKSAGDLVMFEGESQAHILPPVSRIFSVPINFDVSLKHQFDYLRFDIDTTKNGSWYEIDAIKLSGFVKKGNKGFLSGLFK